MMLGEEARHACDAGALREFIERSVAFAQSDDLVAIVERGEQFAEAPDSTEIDGGLGEATFPPDRFQSCWIEGDFFPVGINNFEQVAAVRAAEILSGAIAEIAAGDAAKTKAGWTHGRR